MFKASRHLNDDQSEEGKIMKISSSDYEAERMDEVATIFDPLEGSSQTSSQRR